jgi:hypothetical protein
MTTSGPIVGREVQAFFTQGATWGAELTASPSGSGIYLTEDGISFTQAVDPLDENSSTFQRDADLGTVSAALKLKQNLRYDDLRGIALSLGDGAYATPTEINVGKGDYSHTLYPAPDNHGDFACIALKKGSLIQAAPSVKFLGFTLEAQPSPQRVVLSFETRADTIKNNSTVVTAPQFDDLTAPGGPGGRAYFRQARIFINDQSAAALATPDEIFASGLTFSFRRNLTEDFTNSSGLHVAEPVEDAHPVASCALRQPSFGTEQDAYFTDWLTKTPKKLKIEFTGAAATEATGTVADDAFRLECPHVLIESMDPAPYSGPGRIPASVTFKLLAAHTTADAPGMNFTQPFRLTVVNSQPDKAVS